MGTRKILAHDIRMQKDPQTNEDTFWIFTDVHGVMWVQSTTCTLAPTFHQWYFERKFIKCLMELTWVGSNHFKIF